MRANIRFVSYHYTYLPALCPPSARHLFPRTVPAHLYHLGSHHVAPFPIISIPPSSLLSFLRSRHLSSVPHRLASLVLAPRGWPKANQRRLGEHLHVGYVRWHGYCFRWALLQARGWVSLSVFFSIWSVGWVGRKKEWWRGMRRTSSRVTIGSARF